MLVLVIPCKMRFVLCAPHNTGAHYAKHAVSASMRYCNVLHALRKDHHPLVSMLQMVSAKSQVMLLFLHVG